MDSSPFNTILKGDFQRTIPAKFGLIWCSEFWKEYSNLNFFYLNMPNFNNRYEYAEKKIQRKTLNICWTTFHHVAMVQMWAKIVREIYLYLHHFFLYLFYPVFFCILKQKKRKKCEHYYLVCFVSFSNFSERYIYMLYQDYQT